MEPVPKPLAIDRGISLIEVLVSIVLLGVAGIAVLTALAATTVGARTHREVADTEAALASVGDALTAPGSSWWPCTTSDIASRYQAEIDEQFDGAIDITVTEVHFWNGSTFGTTCESAAGHRLQQVTLEATIGDEAYSATVVKRPPVSVIPTDGTVPIDVEWESTIDWNQGGTATTTTTSTTTSTTTTTTTIATGPTTTSTSTTSTSTTSTSTTSTTTTTAAPGGSLTCVFRVTQTWGSGGNGNLEITNSSGPAISSWHVRVTLGSHGLDLWNANDTTSNGSLTATNLSWNGSVAAGATTAVTGGSISGSSITLETTLPCQVLTS